jgi:hypothetical protein
MAKRPALGSRLVNLRAEPEQPPVIDDGDGDPAAEAALDEAVASLRSESPHDILAALDEIKSLVGDEAWSGIKGKHEQLRSTVETAGKSKAQIAREGLDQHLQWIDSTNLSDVERARATLHAYSSRIDDLDPVEDADTIAGARQMFALVNPNTQDTE